MKVSSRIPLLLSVMLTSCGAIQHTSDDLRRYEQNKTEIARFGKDHVILCSEQHTWRTGALAGAMVGSFAPYDPKTGLGGFSGHWGSLPLAHPERQTGIVAGVTKFLSVNAQGVWNTNSAHPSDVFAEGAGGIFLSVDAFPLHHPPSMVIITASDGKGHPIADLSYNASHNASNDRGWKRHQSDLLDISWKTIEQSDVTRSGAILGIRVMGETGVRRFDIPAEVFRESVTKFKELMARIKSDSKDYMYKCNVTHPELIIN